VTDVLERVWDVVYGVWVWWFILPIAAYLLFRMAILGYFSGVNAAEKKGWRYDDEEEV